jgi:hypothetical protein
LNIKIGYFPGIPDRVAVDPEGSPVEGGHMGAEFALGPAENRGPDKPLLGGEEKSLPVGFPGGTDTEYQGGVGETTGHGPSYHKIRGEYEPGGTLVIIKKNFYSYAGDEKY